jgi:hypothetical protein
MYDKSNAAADGTGLSQKGPSLALSPVPHAAQRQFWLLRVFLLFRGWHILIVYQNSSQLSSFETLILERVLILRRSLLVPEKEEKK